MKSSPILAPAKLAAVLLAALPGPAPADELRAKVESARCPLARITFPIPGTTSTDARPTLRWEPLEGAARYRVRLSSRIPEGNVLLTVDTFVAQTSLVPPRELTTSRAVVKVAVTPDCAPEAKVPRLDEGARFYVDTSPLCKLETLAVSHEGKTALSWPPVANAVTYEVLLYELPEGRLIGRHETRTPSFSAPDATARKAVVAAVRPHCPAATGEFVYLMLGD